MIAWTRRCSAPSWRSRCNRRRVSSAVAIARAREAVSLALLSALAIAAAASSANCAKRSSVSEGSGEPGVLVVSAPHTRPSTTTGTATPACTSSFRAISASPVSSKLSTRTARPVRSTSPVAVPMPDGMRSPSGAGLLHAATASESGVMACSPSSCDASVATTAKISCGTAPRATRSATRRSAAWSSASAARLARTCALAIAMATRSANIPRRSSALAGSGGPEPSTVIAPRRGPR